MLVRELLDYLSSQDPDAEVELAIIEPVAENDDDISVERYAVAATTDWEDDDTGAPLVWLIGGEDDDVEAFLDAVEPDEI